MMDAPYETPRIAGPVGEPKRPRLLPDDGHLLDLFFDWTPDRKTRRRILVDTPARLFGH